MMCWVALDRAVRLAEAGQIPDGHIHRWREQAGAVRAFVEDQCWSETKGSYVRSAGGDDLDASLLLGVLFGFVDPRGPRARGTIDAIRRELGRGPFLHRYSGEDGLPAGRAPSSPARSGWWTPWPGQGRSTRRPS